MTDLETNQPLPGVALQLWVDGKPFKDFRTGEDGRIQIKLPQSEPARLSVIARKTGFTPSVVLLRHESIPDKEIARSYTLGNASGLSDWRPGP